MFQVALIILLVFLYVMFVTYHSFPLEFEYQFGDIWSQVPVCLITFILSWAFKSSPAIYLFIPLSYLASSYFLSLSLSQIHYHSEFLRDKGTYTQVADTLDMKRSLKNTQNLSLVRSFR